MEWRKRPTQPPTVAATPAGDPTTVRTFRAPLQRGPHRAPEIKPSVEASDNDAVTAETADSSSCSRCPIPPSPQGSTDPNTDRDGHPSPQRRRPNPLSEAIDGADWESVKRICLDSPTTASQWETTTNARGDAVLLRPLHRACAVRGVTVDAVRALMDADPEAVKYPDARGRNLLHWAVDRERPSPELVGEILRLRPDCARVREGRFGCLPLHVACCGGAQVEGDGGGSCGGREKWGKEAKEDRLAVIKQLLEVFPQGALCQDTRRGWLPLHVAARNGAPAAVVSALLQVGPAAASVGDNDQRLAIHFIARYANKWEGDDAELERVLGALVKAYPQGTKRREGKSGFTPLHIACSTAHSPPVLRTLISTLLASDPKSVKIPDHSHGLPLHIAARSGAPFGVLRDLLMADPATAAEKDKDGRLALHWACHSNAPVASVDALLRVFPAGASEPESKYGFSPLHVALNRNADVDIVGAILHHHPRGARAKDKRGSLPLHAACKNATGAVASSMPRLVWMLVHAYPEGTRIKDRDGKCPSDFVLGNKSRLEEETRTGLLGILGDGSTAGLGRYEEEEEPTWAIPSTHTGCSYGSSPRSGSESGSSLGHSRKSVLESLGTLTISGRKTPKGSAQRSPGGSHGSWDNAMAPLNTRRIETASTQGGEDLLCFFCGSGGVEYALEPCGHVRLCRQCIGKKRGDMDNLCGVCPVCGCGLRGAESILMEC